MNDFVAVGDGYRAWRDPQRCNHSNGDICASCDFDRYYAGKYPTVPWATTTEGDSQ